MARKGIFGELSALQLVAGALAAMTSAWLASWLGVAGTLIGAAVGSVVAGTASTLYSASLQRGIERSKTLLVTEQGSVVEGASQGEESVVEADAVADDDPATASDRAALLSRVNWKTVALVSVATLLIAVAVIGAYEVVSGRSFGNESNSRIVPSSVTRDGDATPQGPDAPAPTPTTTTGPDDPDPGPTPTPSVTPSQEPTAEAPEAPTPAPTPGESSPLP
ncbi:hypothetical protein D9V41_07975 [Aeromicrobium phragmitis]|uniref:Uncharacterized protein n=1 Tax=Aeromicrobium phragmitis TaxID=2478914 RepID=A0A3L8PKJ4_9ACTN|nr:hypothetical protein [Aeromicrobium phragmitis]RLV55841.1 hypothetical protein D9V41_07975 [Aeromicrobium phragmitis]